MTIQSVTHENSVHRLSNGFQPDLLENLQITMPTLSQSNYITKTIVLDPLVHTLLVGMRSHWKHTGMI